MTIESSGNSGMDTARRCAMLRANAMSAAPLLSVIVVCQNPGSRLPAALASLWEQRWVEPELIVVDRGSTDGTVAWLETQRPRIAAMISAPAASHFDALNQAVAAAHGEWTFFFGAADRLVGEIVLSETLNWMKRTEAGVVAGEAAFDDGRIQKLHSRVNPTARNFVPASATFYRRTLFEENGPFDPTFLTAADYEFNVRLWKNRVRFKPIPLRIAACDARRASAAWQTAREEIAIRHRYFPAWRCAAWDALSVLRCVRRKLLPAR